MQPERQNQILWIYKLPLNISFFSFFWFGFFFKNNRKVFVSVIEISSLESSMDDKLAQDENEII